MSRSGILIYLLQNTPLRKVHLQSQVMSCYTQCVPCRPCGPTPLASSCNEPCVRQCQDSTIAIEPSPVVVTLPGPILSSFPQNTVVGSSTSAAVGRILSSEGVPSPRGALTCPAWAAAPVAEGARPAEAAGPGEIVPENRNVVLDQQDIFKPLRSDYLTILSYSMNCCQEEAILGFMSTCLMSQLPFLIPTYLCLHFFSDLFFPMIL
ncbi:LOW QUALITY PROTEIN: uncharacterized protein LOC125684490 [Lagopus muta]|uniref:LOW QUALITY PROTEIN: uncharacterized protein LOC125684490 n=1 Tax=Lagopus muta TaxID=64668 RepID=UPI0020A1FBD6|nr:LOW QUALITY PROTEIN: uncharacterized protein LOC125684490 [Lagopus muta]